MSTTAEGELVSSPGSEHETKEEYGVSLGRPVSTANR